MVEWIVNELSHHSHDGVSVNHKHMCDVLWMESGEMLHEQAPISMLTIQQEAEWNIDRIKS